MHTLSPKLSDSRTGDSIRIVLSTDHGSRTGTVTAATTAVRRTARPTPSDHHSSRKTGATTSDTGRTRPTRLSNTPSATRRRVPGWRATAGVAKATRNISTSRTRNSVSVNTTPLWNTRLGQIAVAAAATSPTATPASRRPRWNVSHTSTTERTTLAATAVPNSDTSPGSRRATQKIGARKSG